jgi:hypothetical protein
MVGLIQGERDRCGSQVGWFSQLRVSRVNLCVLCVCSIVIFKFLGLLVFIFLHRFIKLFKWYQSEVIIFRGTYLLLGFSLFVKRNGILGLQ